MTVPNSAPNWIVAAILAAAAFYWLRDTLAPLTLALILWLSIDSLAKAIRRRAPLVPFWFALLLALLVVLGFASLVVYALTRDIGDIIANSGLIQSRFEALVLEVQRALRIGGQPWTLQTLLAQVGPTTVLNRIATLLQSLASNTVLILVDLLFIFPAAAAFRQKLPQMTPNPETRRRTEIVLGSIRTSVERYLQVQTLVSLMISILSFATLSVIGLEYPLFWTSLIFFLNYIPTIGSIIAVALPSLFALSQHADWRFAALVAIGLHVWQFGIGTFIQPRMTGASLNLSTIVVVLSLSFWGGLWGVTGVLLAAPLTVFVMIVLEQFPATHWIAVALSADGRPAPASHMQAPDEHAPG